MTDQSVQMTEMLNRHLLAEYNAMRLCILIHQSNLIGHMQLICSRHVESLLLGHWGQIALSHLLFL